jgi:hypothetical protein
VKKTVVGKAEDHLVRAVVSCGKLCAVGKIPVIPLSFVGLPIYQNTRTNCYHHNLAEPERWAAKQDGLKR